MHDLFAAYTQNLNTKKYNFVSIWVSELNIFAKKYAHLNRDVKNGAIHIPIKKKWVSHIQFSWKKGTYRIPGSAEKGGYSGRTSVPCHI